MFPINWNDVFRKKDGTLTTMESLGEGGGGGGGSDSKIYTGNTLPDDSLGKEGDIYLLIPSEQYQKFTLTITKALRGDTEQQYCGAQEIQLFLRNGETLKNIREFPDFNVKANNGSISYAFNGDTAGTYWESSVMPTVIDFAATIPIGWTLDSLVVWQRNSETYVDVWKDFVLSLSGVPVLTETNLTQSDWKGVGKGTTFDIANEKSALPNVSSTFYKVKLDNVTQWIR